MLDRDAILLFIDDEAVLSSLQFSLSLEGLPVIKGEADLDSSLAAALVIDQNYLADGLAFLCDLRTRNCKVAAIILATNPNVGLRARVAALGADLIEKPLLGDELSHAISKLIEMRKAA